MRKTHSYGAILLLSIFFSGALWSAAAHSEAQERLPWTLREHYTFGGELLRMDYAKDNAEWRVKLYEIDSEQARMHPDVIVRDVGFTIELGDGRIITNDMLGDGGETFFERESFTSEFFGEGTKFSVRFMPYDGLAVEHKISRFRGWNFLLISVAVTNISDAPITVTRIRPAIFASGAISGLSANAQVHTRNMVFRGGYPVFTRDGAAATMRMHDPERNVSMALGILPSGMAESVVDIQGGAGAWQGRIETSFAPGAVVASGATLESDPIWFCMDMSQVIADAQYAWLLRYYCRGESQRNAPRAWVTIPDTAGLSVLLQEAERARSMGITHALIPGNWEGRPGTFEGGPPQYPRNIGGAARSLRDAGVTPGITIDPLLADSSSGDWRAQSADGRNWTNLSAEAGRAFARDRIRGLISDGFGLIAIEKSHIPDEVLQAFNMTRGQADTLAFDVANDAVAGANVAVLPTSEAHLSLARDEWLAAAGAVARLGEYDIGTAAVQLRIGGDASLDAETTLAMRFWRGPIEFVGAPPRSLQSEMGVLLGGRPLVARPQDTERKSPLTWLLRSSNTSIGYIGASVLSFSGAAPWQISGAETFGGEAAPTLLWRPEQDKPIEVTDGVISEAPRFSTHGLLGDAAQPLFAGTTEEITLGLDRLRRLDWDAARGTLTGQIEAAPGVSSAFFLMPSHLTLRAARVGSRQVRPVVEGRWILLPLDASGGAFELEFAAR